MSFYNEPTLSMSLRRIARASLRLIPLFMVSLALLATGYAQSSGTIQGKVKNASTGRLLYNATVTIEETGRTTQTDAYGVYRFTSVPEGSYTIRANYVGLTGQTTMVTVESGVSTNGDLTLVSSRTASEMGEEEVFELEAFDVEGTSSYDSNSIALNEQRNSDNLVTVQHAEAFGEIAEGNIGEYLKNLPGVAVDYVAADVRAIKLRGMSSAFTQVTVDGSQMASAGSGNKIRSFELEQVSLANVEQLEVSKLPRPDMPANAIGGSVNLVSKNAFTAGGRKLTYKASINFNDAESSLSPTPGWPADTERSKVLPGIELSYSDVFMDDRLGFNFTYKNSNVFNVQQRFRWREWELEPQGGNGTADDIYFLRLEAQDGPKKTSRESFSTNVDFKINENTIFSFRGQANTYDATWFNRNRSWRINPEDDLSALGLTGSTDDNSSAGYAVGGNRGLGFGGSFRAKFGSTIHLDFGMKHYINDWVVDYGYTSSVATNHYADNDRGIMETWEAGYRGDGEYVVFDQTQGDQYAFSDIQVYDADGNMLPQRGFALSDFELRRTRERPKESVDRIDGLRVNARRNFTFGENQGYFQFGARTSHQEREGYQLELRYEYDGYNTDGERIWFDDIKDDVYSGQNPGFGYEGWDWPSIAQIHDIYNTDTTRWELDEARAINNTIGTWFEAEEDINALYAMGKVELLDNKLGILAGVRWEETDVSGLVPLDGDPSNYVLSPTDFNFATLEVGSSYDNFHPSVHVTYEVTPDLILRASYANTIGRPDFGSMFGPTTIFEPDPTDEDSTQGYIETTNPALLPRESDNIDLTAEYYYGQTGLFSVSVFQNDMSNYIESVERPVTAEDIDTYGLPDYVFGGPDEYRIRTTFNSGDATVEGLEVNWEQDLNYDFVPSLLRKSSLYANGTFLSTSGGISNDLNGFTPTTINYGFLFDYGRLDFKLRWNIRGDEVGSTSIRDYDLAGGAGEAYLYREKRQQLDFDAGFRINDKAQLFVNARNLSDTPFRQGYFVPGENGDRTLILEREERFGVQWTFGVKGEF